MLRFKELYQKEIRTNLQGKFNYLNSMQIPKIEKVSLNMGVGEAALDSKLINSALADLTLIAGQKAVVTKAKKSIAVFKLRQGMDIGCKVTLRKNKAYEFLERLVMIVLPRSKDFRGFHLKNFDGSGNLSFGIKEHTLFSEIDHDKTDKIKGLNITIATSAKTNEEAKELLTGFHIPFRKQINN